jgi:hypothetical protein
MNMPMKACRGLGAEHLQREQPPTGATGSDESTVIGWRKLS